jgi:hypothetical protein
MYDIIIQANSKIKKITWIIYGNLIHDNNRLC